MTGGEGVNFNFFFPPPKSPIIIAFAQRLRKFSTLWFRTTEQALRYGLVSTIRTVKLDFGVVSNVFTSISNTLIKAKATFKKNYV